MKKNIFTIGMIVLGTSLNAQVVEDSVALGAYYENESYYNLEDGEVANVANNNWDLAFDMSSFGATIRANRLDEVYVYPGGIEDWETLDTTGITEWTRYYNSDESWSFGALNAPADPDEDVDLGWGEYNTTTHFTEGSRIFVVKLQSEDYKKLFIEELGGGVYTFKYDFLDNSDLVTDMIDKDDYSEQNFIHYSLDTKEVVSREPNWDEWDIVFSNYHTELAPDVFYGVTGVLSNAGVQVLQVDDVPSDEATFDAAFDLTTNIIGHDWKSFNLDTYMYDIADSLTYFIQSQAGNVWKVIFTGFNGSSDGKIYFTKEMVSAAGIDEVAQTQIEIFPNPTTDFLNITATQDGIEAVNVYNTNGQLVLSNSTTVALNNVQIDVNNLESGMYIIETVTTSGITTVQKALVTD